MKNIVYCLLAGEEYHGTSLEAVFATRALAVAAKKKEEKKITAAAWYEVRAFRIRGVKL